MNRLTWTALVPLLLSMAMVFSTYSYGSQSGLEAFTVSLVLSAPLIFTFLLVFSFCRDSAANRQALFVNIDVAVGVCAHFVTRMVRRLAFR